MKSKKTPRYSNPEITLKQIGERLKEIRKSKGYDNYEKFAYEHNIPRAQYGRYERGISDLRVSSLLKILDAFDMTLEEFFKVF